MNAASVRRAAGVALAALAVSHAGVASAEEFSVPPGSLGDVVLTLGAQARATIILSDPGLAGRRSPGAKGSLSLRAALALALKDTGAEAIFFGNRIVYIRRKPAVPRSPRRDSEPVPAMLDEREIIVTATKQSIGAGNYPGTVKILQADDGWDGHAGDGSAAITRRLPILGSTNLGMGRNKLFIRGISDSSFSGPTQATTGQYLGDIRLNYNAPDPDLNLYDMQRVEVLVGPQGTLYGAGSLGGIVRLVPNVPNLAEFSATAAFNLGATLHGAPSADGAAMANIPLQNDRIGLRIVAYGARAGGYIDAPQPRRRDINTITSYGQRLSLRVSDIGGWTVDLGQVAQNIYTRDGQYTLRDDPPFTRRGEIQQPFRNNYRLGYLSATRPIGTLKLALVASVAQQELSSVFDATGIDGTKLPATYAEKSEITFASNELRISGGAVLAPWVAGLTLAKSATQFELAITNSEHEEVRAKVQNDQLEAALFGELTRPIAEQLALTLGGRATFAQNSREVSGLSLVFPREPTRASLRFTGSAALHWKPRAPFTMFARYQQGFRPGGLGLTVANSEIVPRRYTADKLSVAELGLRWNQQPRSRVSVQFSIFYADWKDIQADLVSELLLPHTANIGDGSLRGIDFEATLRPTKSLSVSASLFVTQSWLRDLNPEYEITSQGMRANRPNMLPNVAKNGGRFAAEWRTTVLSDGSLKLNAAVRYVGRSYLGLGERFAIAQGKYWVSDACIRFERASWGITASISNFGNSKSNTFAYGNPVGVVRGDQVTPVRPLTVKIGFDARF